VTRKHRHNFTPVSEAITEVMKMLSAIDALSPRLKNLLMEARVIVDKHVLFQQSGERAAKLAALEAAIAEQDGRLEKKK
jgi:hypothetical protein